MNSTTKSTLSKVLLFVAGAGIGSAATWGILKYRYDRLMKEEIASVEEQFSNLYCNGEDNTEESKDDVEEEDEPDSEPEYDRVVKHLGYSNTEVKGQVKPVVIAPEEFGDLDDYEVISLTYYADGVLADELDEPVEDVEGSVGRDSLTTFGEYEEDAVHVRNDRLHAYYEILFDTRNYYGDIDTSHLAEGE